MLVCPKCGLVYTREVDHCGLDGHRLVSSMEDPLLGRTIDRYRVDAAIGSGGMARVYRAHHVYLEQDFALKILHGEIAVDKDLARRFRREAKALSRIKHPNVVTIADFGTTQEGLLFMVMEFLDGPTLSGALKDEGPMRARRAADILRQTCLGLDAAHARGYVHRDLKPGNIALVPDGEDEIVKLLDFGLVRITEPDGETVKLTQQGMFFGTPLYMSPEQLRGEQAGPRSDLYALGVVLYQMLTGTPPFLGDVKQLAHQHLNSEPPVPALSYSGLTDLALDLLQKDPEDRPKSAKAVIQRIDGLTIAPSPRARKRAAAAAPAVAAEPITRVDRSVLAKPVLDEERSFMGHEGEPMSQSIRAALGLRAYIKGWVPLTAFFILSAAAGYYLWSGGQLPNLGVLTSMISGPKDPPETAPDAAPAESIPPAQPKPAAPKADSPKKARPKAASPSKRATKKKPPTRPTKNTRPTPAAPPPPAKPVKPEAPPPPDVEVKDYKVAKTDEPSKPDPSAPPAKTFSELDMNLGWALNRKGLAWADLAAVASSPARQWGQWYKRTSEPEPALLERTYSALMDAVDGIAVDAALLKAKLRRCKKILNRHASQAGQRRYDGLGSRYASLMRDAGFSPLRRDAAAISTEISLLETDLKVFESELKRQANTRTSTAG